MRRAVSTDDPMRFEIEEYEPEAPGPGEVLLRVRASGICGSDLHSYRDQSRWLSPEGGWQAGRTPGHEVSGEVAEVGEKVTALHEGQRVALQPRPFCGTCSACRSGRTELCRYSPGLFGEQMPGGCSEYLTVPAENLFLVEEDLDFAVVDAVIPLSFLERIDDDTDWVVQNGEFGTLAKIRRLKKTVQQKDDEIQEIHYD